MRSTDVADTVEEATEEGSRRWRWLSIKTRLAAAAAERGHDAAAMAKEMFDGWVPLRAAAMQNRALENTCFFSPGAGCLRPLTTCPREPNKKIISRFRVVSVYRSVPARVQDFSHMELICFGGGSCIWRKFISVALDPPPGTLSLRFMAA